MRKLISLLFLTLSSGAVMAQYESPTRQKYLDVALSGGTNFSTALSYNQLYGKRFKIGWGLRYTGYFGKSTELITAPARLTSGKTDPTVLFSENILANFDTLTLSSVQTNSLNAVIHLQYQIVRRLEVGFNIDAIGVSFGPEQSGSFRASESAALNNSAQTAQPTFFNLLLVSDNDRGSLNSELYARYWFNDRIAVRAGVSFQFIEYTTTRKLTFDNDRFRYKSLQPMVAISWSPFKK